MGISMCSLSTSLPLINTWLFAWRWPPCYTRWLDEFDDPALAGKTSDAEAFLRELAQRVPQHGDALMTIAQQLEQKDIEKRIQLGEQRGIEKGEREATLKITRTKLENGIDCNTVMKMTGLIEGDLTKIRH